MAELPDPCRPQAAMLRAFCPLSRQYGVFSSPKSNSEGGACIPPCMAAVGKYLYAEQYGTVSGRCDQM